MIGDGHRLTEGHLARHTPRSSSVSDEVARLVKVMTKAGKPARAPIVYDSDPRRLVRRLVKATENHKAVAFHWEG